MLHSIKKIVQNVPFFSSLPVMFDLGTHTTKIAIKNKGVVLREPTCIGMRSQPREYIFFGTEAKEIIGKTPDFMSIIKPIVNGIVSDFDSEVALLRYYIEKSVSPYTKSSLIKPPLRAIASIPTIATEIEQKAVEEALMKAGCSSVCLIKKPLATATGAGFDVFFHHPHFIVDFGAGLTEMSIISGGGIVSQKTLKLAGDHMDKVIANYVHLKHGILLGESTCERLKISCLTFEDKEITDLVRGKSLENGLPKSVKIRSSELREALSPTLSLITDGMKELLEVSHPEIVDDIFEEGILITGKIATLPGLKQMIADELKMKVVLPEHAEEATVYGLLEIEKHKEHLLNIKIKTD